MTRKILTILTVLLALCTSSSAQFLKGTVVLNGEEIAAEYIQLTPTTVALGTGHNACISPYSEGRVTIPGTLTIGANTYTVTEISNLAFRLCTKITFVNVQENVTRIGDYAFSGCTSLTEVKLPATLASLGSGAFIDLPLLSVTCASPTPPTWEYNDVFFNHDSGISDDQTYAFPEYVPLNVPSSATQAYQEALYTNTAIGWTTPDGWGRCFAKVGDAFYESYHIYDAIGLDRLRALCNEGKGGEAIKRVVLEADIDMDGYTWDCGIGIADHEFQGNFDGQGHTISHLTVANTQYTGKGAGLFGFFAGERISHVRLKDCQFTDKYQAGSLVGYAGASCLIDSVFVEDCDVSSEKCAGGLVGKSYSELNIRDCALFGSAGGIGGVSDVMGSVVGQGTSVGIRHCAVGVATSRDDQGTFVGKTTSTKAAAINVDSCYTVYETKRQPEHYVFGDNIIYHGDKFTYYAGGQATEHVFGDINDYMRGFNMVPYLGTANWIYKHGAYPLPDCFADVWPVEVNVMTIGSGESAMRRLNNLSPSTVFDDRAWHTQDPADDFHFKSFDATRLWIDESISPDPIARPQILPVGIGTITASDGVQYARQLRAINTGVRQTEEVPIYEFDDKGYLKEDDEGNPISTGTTTTIETDWAYTPVGYSVYLPYTTLLPSTCKLYQPHQLEVASGTTTVTFKQVSDNTIQAFTPYYVIVETDTVQLGTYAEATFPPMEETTIDLGSYEFKGTNHYISHFNAGPTRENAYILQSDGKWHQVTAESTAAIPAFRAYFRPTSSSAANTLSMVLSDGQTGIVQIRTIDADGTTHFYDLSGRRLHDKPQKGIYIHQGRKIMVK